MARWSAVGMREWRGWIWTFLSRIWSVKIPFSFDISAQPVTKTRMAPSPLVWWIFCTSVATKSKLTSEDSQAGLDNELITWGE